MSTITALTFTPALPPGNPAFVEIPSGQDLRTAWTSAFTPAINFNNISSVTGAWANTIGGGFTFTSNPLSPAFPATWTTSPISGAGGISVWPDAMTASDLTSNPFLTRESKLTITGIAGTGGPCPGGTDQTQEITLNQTNYAIVPGSVASPVSLLVLRANTQQSLNILSNAKWQASASAGTVPYADILSSYTTAQTGSERHDGSYNSNTFTYRSTNPVTQGKKYETAQVTFSDTDGRANPVTVNIMQCQGTPDMSSVTTNADNAATSVATAPAEWSGKVVRHEAKSGVYAEFYSADFGAAGRWMTTNLAASAYDSNITTATLPTSTDASDSYTDPYWCYPNGGTGGSTATDYNNNPHLGLLYNWPAATAKKSEISNEGNTDHAAVQGICPNGWHLPSDKEWTALENEIIRRTTAYANVSSNISPDGTSNVLTGNETGYRGIHGQAMKEVCGLNSTVPNGLSNSLASDGFSVLLAGMACVGRTHYFGYSAYFWSSSSAFSGSAWIRSPRDGTAAVYRDYYFRSDLLSVRCKKD